MIIYELVGGQEDNPLYQNVEAANGVRHYGFLETMVGAALASGKHVLSHTLLKALNYHAIACLHADAGEYRTYPVQVGEGEGKFTPPEHYRVKALMEDFVDMVNRIWETAPPLGLAASVLWRLNYIHPFVNGNGRTARAAAYFVVCVKAGAWLPGTTILPEMLRANASRYVDALKQGDQTYGEDLSLLTALLDELLREQLDGTQ